MNKKILVCLTMISLLAVTGCGKSTKKEVPAETVMPIEQDATQEEIQEQLGDSLVSTENNEESGITADNYENSTFAGHEGKISFFYNEDGSVMYYKWFTNEKDERKSKEIYADVCGALTGSYGDGEESNNKASKLYTTSYTNDKQQITAQIQGNDSGWEISYTVVG